MKTKLKTLFVFVITILLLAAFRPSFIYADEYDLVIHNGDYEVQFKKGQIVSGEESFIDGISVSYEEDTGWNILNVNQPTIIDVYDTFFLKHLLCGENYSLLVINLLNDLTINYHITTSSDNDASIIYSEDTIYFAGNGTLNINVLNGNEESITLNGNLNAFEGKNISFVPNFLGNTTPYREKVYITDKIDYSSIDENSSFSFTGIKSVEFLINNTEMEVHVPNIGFDVGISNDIGQVSVQGYSNILISASNSPLSSSFIGINAPGQDAFYISGPSTLKIIDLYHHYDNSNPSSINSIGICVDQPLMFGIGNSEVIIELDPSFDAIKSNCKLKVENNATLKTTGRINASSLEIEDSNFDIYSNNEAILVNENSSISLNNTSNYGVILRTTSQTKPCIRVSGEGNSFQINSSLIENGSNIDGYNLNDCGTTYTLGNNDSETLNKIYRIGKAYLLRYHTNREDITLNNQVLFSNAQIENEIVDLTNDDHRIIFEGWYLDEDFNNPLNQLDSPINDLDLYAKWTITTPSLEIVVDNTLEQPIIKTFNNIEGQDSSIEGLIISYDSINDCFIIDVEEDKTTNLICRFKEDISNVINCNRDLIIKGKGTINFVSKKNEGYEGDTPTYINVDGDIIIGDDSSSLSLIMDFDYSNYDAGYKTKGIKANHFIFNNTDFNYKGCGYVFHSLLQNNSSLDQITNVFESINSIFNIEYKRELDSNETQFFTIDSTVGNWRMLIQDDSEIHFHIDEYLFPTIMNPLISLSGNNCEIIANDSLFDLASSGNSVGISASKLYFERCRLNMDFEGNYSVAFTSKDLSLIDTVFDINVGRYLNNCSEPTTLNIIENSDIYGGTFKNHYGTSGSLLNCSLLVNPNLINIQYCGISELTVSKFVDGEPYVPNGIVGPVSDEQMYNYTFSISDTPDNIEEVKLNYLNIKRKYWVTTFYPDDTEQTLYVLPNSLIGEINPKTIDGLRFNGWREVHGGHVYDDEVVTKDMDIYGYYVGVNVVIHNDDKTVKYIDDELVEGSESDIGGLSVGIDESIGWLSLDVNEPTTINVYDTFFLEEVKTHDGYFQFIINLNSDLTINCYITSALDEDLNIIGVEDELFFCGNGSLTINLMTDETASSIILNNDITFIGTESSLVISPTMLTAGSEREVISLNDCLDYSRFNNDSDFKITGIKSENQLTILKTDLTVNVPDIGFDVGDSEDCGQLDIGSGSNVKIESTNSPFSDEFHGIHTRGLGYTDIARTSSLKIIDHYHPYNQNVPNSLNSYGMFVETTLLFSIKSNVLIDMDPSLTAIKTSIKINAEKANIKTIGNIDAKAVELINSNLDVYSNNEVLIVHDNSSITLDDDSYGIMLRTTNSEKPCINRNDKELIITASQILNSSNIEGLSYNSLGNSYTVKEYNDEINNKLYKIGNIYFVRYHTNLDDVSLDSNVIFKRLLSDDDIKTLPEIDGYEFGGWYIDEELENELDFNVIPTGDIDLYAKLIETIPSKHLEIYNGNNILSYTNETYTGNLIDGLNIKFENGNYSIEVIDNVTLSSNNYKEITNSIIFEDIYASIYSDTKLYIYPKNSGKKLNIEFNNDGRRKEIVGIYSLDDVIIGDPDIAFELNFNNKNISLNSRSHTYAILCSQEIKINNIKSNSKLSGSYIYTSLDCSRANQYPCVIINSDITFNADEKFSGADRMYGSNMLFCFINAANSYITNSTIVSDLSSFECDWSIFFGSKKYGFYINECDIKSYGYQVFAFENFNTSVLEIINSNIDAVSRSVSLLSANTSPVKLKYTDKNKSCVLSVNNVNPNVALATYPAFVCNGGIDLVDVDTANGFVVKASTNSDGSDSVDYVSDNLNTYKWLKIYYVQPITPKKDNNNNNKTYLIPKTGI